MSDFKSSNDLLLTEELHILLIDRCHGGLVDANDSHLQYAFAGAILMDLANADRIDTTLSDLIVIDLSPTDDDILDYGLNIIDQQQSRKSTIDQWVKHFSSREIINHIRRYTVERLIKRGIFHHDPGGLISLDERVELTGRYPNIPLPNGLDILLRVINTVITDEIPSPREVMLIALVEASGISDHIFTRSISDQRTDRIALISRMDSIGRSIRTSISESHRIHQETDPLQRIHHNLTYPTTKKPPLASGALPLIGHSHIIRPVPTVPLSNFYNSLGSVFRVRDFRKEVTVLAGPEANLFCQKRGRSLFRSHDAYSSFAEAMDTPRILLAMDGEDHLKLRKGLSSGFSGKRYLDLLPEIRDVILNEIPENGTRSVGHMFTHLTAKSIGLACNGYTPTTQQVEDLDFFMRRLVAMTVLQFIPDLFNNFALKSKKLQHAKSGFFSIFSSTVDHGFQTLGDDHKDNILKALLEFHQKSPQFMPEQEVRTSSLGPIFAGMHTTASTATSALYLLLKHPQIFKEAQKEADDFFLLPHELMANHLGELDIIPRLIMETLRLYNPFNSVFRTAINSFDFGGYTIAAGTQLLIPFCVTHYCKEFFPNPERFDIDRYLPNRKEHRQPGVYMPYGFGTHRCLGSSIADLHLIFCLATILHYRHLSLDPPNYTLKMISDGVPIASRKFKIKLSPRVLATFKGKRLSSHQDLTMDPPPQCPFSSQIRQS